MKSTGLPYNRSALRRAMMMQRQSTLDPISNNPTPKVMHRGFEHLTSAPVAPWSPAPGDVVQQPKIMPEQRPAHYVDPTVISAETGVEHSHNMPTRGMWAFRKRG